MDLDLFKFYQGKHVLLTGCTGFVGKVLLEKVLRSLPETGKLYLMVREKKGMTKEQRFVKIFESYCFNRYKREFKSSA